MGGSMGGLWIDVGPLLLVHAVCTARPGDSTPTWELRATTGPSPRWVMGMTYDSARQRVVLFGGATGFYPGMTFHGDTWEWDGNTWEQVSTTGPEPRFEMAMAFDSIRDVVVLNGGANLNAPVHHVGGTWEWDGSAWVLRTMGGPVARHAHAMAFDSSRGRSVIFGEKDLLGTDTWEWDGTDWFHITDVGPTCRGWYSFVYDAARGVSTMFGGQERPTGINLNETWAWDGSRWQFLSNTGPSPRHGTGMVYDAHRQRVVIFGGDAGQVVNDVWEWDGAAWSPVQTVNTPVARRYHGMAYDAARRRIVVFGGSTMTGMLGDTWELAFDPGACYADCNADAMLDVSDFGCFSNRFIAGDPYADCNGDALLDIADFGCFTNAFIVGCP